MHSGLKQPLSYIAILTSTTLALIPVHSASPNWGCKAIEKHLPILVRNITSSPIENLFFIKISSLLRHNKYYSNTISPLIIRNIIDIISIKHNIIITTDIILEQSLQLNITLIPNTTAPTANIINVITKTKSNI